MERPWSPYSDGSVNGPRSVSTGPSGDCEQSRRGVRDTPRRRFLAGVAAACALTRGQHWRATADEDEPVVRVKLDTVGADAW